MANIKMNLVTVKTTNGINEANIIKSKLESYGIPTLLKYESVGIVFGLELNGLGKVEVKVPKEFEEEALLLLNLNE
jgi:hypothetical protein